MREPETGWKPGWKPILHCTVVVTPHVGFVTEETYKIFYRDTVENIVAWLSGRPAGQGSVGA